MRRNIRAFTLVEMMIVVAIVGLLAAIAFPNFVKSRTTAQTRFCIDNLRHVDGAKQEWALERKVAATAIPDATDIEPYIGRGSGALPLCPSDPLRTFATSYSLNDLTMPPTCLAAPETHILP
jgi:prepilin-type N-terminal cleavage/methylation domain-containing protein